MTPSRSPGSTAGFVADLRRGTDLLRGVAVLLVVFFHVVKDALPQLLADSAFQPYALLTNFGVDLFVLLSGFGLTVAFLERADAGPPGPSPWRGWALRRFLRVGPPYWLVLAALVAVGVALGDGDRWLVERPRSIDTGNVLLAFAGLHGFYQPYAYRIYGPFWFISLILLCYVLFRVLGSRIRARDAGTVLVVTLALGIAAVVLRTNGVRWLNPVPLLATVDFGGGVLLGMLASEPSTEGAPRVVLGRLQRALVALGALVWVALALRYRYPYLLYPLLSVSVAALSLSVFAARPLRPLRRVLEWLGRRSYELFLVHMPLVTSLRLDRLAEPPVAAGPAVALGLGAALVIAVGLRAAHARLLRRRRG